MKLEGLRKFLAFVITIAALTVLGLVNAVAIDTIVWGICGLSASYLGLQGWLDRNPKPQSGVKYPKPGESNDPM